MHRNTPTLYIQSGSHACREAMAFFAQHGVSLDVRKVDDSPQNLQRLLEVTEQTETPTFVYKDCIITDFTIEEFLDEIQTYPDILRDLGLSLEALED